MNSVQSSLLHLPSSLVKYKSNYLETKNPLLDIPDLYVGAASSCCDLFSKLHEQRENTCMHDTRILTPKS